MFTKTEQTILECMDDIFCGVSTVADLDNATDLEKKHLPVLSVPQSIKKGECFEVTMAIGKLRAYEHCNLHGTCESEVDMEVT